MDRLTNEKIDLERKLEILADKIREYRSDEDALKDALLGAQKQGNAIIADAKNTAQEAIDRANAKAASILEEADIKSRDIIASAETQVERLNITIKQEEEKSLNTLNRMKSEVSSFKSQLLDLYKAHLDLITQLPEEEIEEDISNEIEEIDSNIDEEEFAELAEPINVSQEDDDIEKDIDTTIEDANAEGAEQDDDADEDDLIFAEAEKSIGKAFNFDEESQKQWESGINNPLFVPHEDDKTDKYTDKGFGELQFGNNNK
ncbi:MAG: hypothetical protein GX967_06650 [Clostridiales bacterium]|nr:hypothetical protein [Clostridiales bacterium]